MPGRASAIGRSGTIEREDDEHEYVAFGWDVGLEVNARHDGARARILSFRERRVAHRSRPSARGKGSIDESFEALQSLVEIQATEAEPKMLLPVAEHGARQNEHPFGLNELLGEAIDRQRASAGRQHCPRAARPSESKPAARSRPALGLASGAASLDQKASAATTALIKLTPNESSCWYSHLVSATEPTDFPMPEVDPNGVDLAQVRRMLALTPAERLRLLESALASMMKVRDAAQRAQVPRNPAAPR